MLEMQIEKMHQAHKIVADAPFEIVQLNRGYANRTLHIDISSNTIETKPVTQQMKDLWIGGKGFDLWLTFQLINRDTKWDSPENPLCFSSGPLGGTTSFPGSGKTIATTISPLTHSMMDCNVGGYFGPYLKFAGFDALSVAGKADEETIVVIDAVKARITIEQAPMESVDSHLLAEELTEMYADDELDKRNIAIISAGRGAQHSRMGVLNFSFYDWRRRVARLKQAGRGGLGTVFRDKKLKAIVIKNRGITPAWRVHESKAALKMRPKELKKVPDEKMHTICDIIAKWNRDPEYVIEMMQDIQNEFRCIPQAAIDELTAQTGTPRSWLYHIATFYKAFSLEEKGETIIQVCMGTACHVKGSAKILDEFERELGCPVGGTTEDRKFSLEGVACLGACSIAPVVKIGEEVHGGVQVKDVRKLIEQAKKEKNHA